MLMPLLAVVAETPSPSPEPTRYIDPQTVTPGLVGFVIFVALAVGTFILWRSMNKQLKRIDFDEGAGPAEGPPAAADGAENSGGPAEPESGERPVELRDKG